WKEFETYIYSIYSAFGYATIRNVLVAGNQIDLLCEKHVDGFQRAKIVIECKLHRNGRAVGLDEVNKFVHVANSLIAGGNATGGAMITNTDFSKEARAAAAPHRLVALKTVSELESELFDFSHLYNTSVFDYEREEIFQTYVPMSANISDVS